MSLLYILSNTWCCDQMSQNTSSVNSLPHKGIVWELVNLVPCKLCCHKVLNAALLHDLRKGTAVTKYIWQPQNLAVDVKLILKELLSVKELTYKRLAGGQVTVSLKPHTTFWNPSSFLNALLYFCINLWIALF